MNLSEILSLSGKELSQRMAEGYPVEPSAIENCRYHGVSLGLPRWIERISWKTFMKVFYREDGTNELRGWNVRLEQTGVEGAPVVSTRRGEPKTFGHFRVTSLEPYHVPRPCAPGLMLDYGRAGNRRADPIQALRDPLVSLQEGETDWLLGWSYLDLGMFRLSTPSYFLLRRVGAVDHVATPPRER